QGTVYVLREEKAVPVRVRLGISDGPSTEVGSGEIKPGEQVIASIGSQASAPHGRLFGFWVSAASCFIRFISFRLIEPGSSRRRYPNPQFAQDLQDGRYRSARFKRRELFNRSRRVRGGDGRIGFG